MGAGANIVNTSHMIQVQKEVNNHFAIFENAIEYSNLTTSQKKEALNEVKEAKKDILRKVFNSSENQQNDTNLSNKTLQDKVNTSNIQKGEISKNNANEIIDSQYKKKIFEKLYDYASGLDNEDGYISENDIDDLIEQTMYSLDEETSQYIDSLYEKLENDEIDDFNPELYALQKDAIENKLAELGYKYDKDFGGYSKLSELYDSHEKILKYLDNNNIDYEVSKSTSSGVFPSIYVKNNDGDVVMRIANHYNSYGSYNTDKYTNQELMDTNKIIKDIQSKLGNNNLQLKEDNEVKYDAIKDDVDINENKEYTTRIVERKQEPSNYVYKKITDKDKARVSSDYLTNKEKYKDKNFVHFDDVSYGYIVKNDEVEVVRKFKGSQKFIRDVEEAWENGVDKLSNGDTKITKSIRSAKRRSNTSDGISRGQPKSGKGNREITRYGGQQGGINSTETTKNNGNNLKNSEQQGSNFMSENEIRYDVELNQKEVESQDDETRYDMIPLKDGFYSQLESTIINKMPRQASTKDVMNLIQKNGVKQDEIAWTGIDDYLASKDTVMKDELLEYIRANQIEIEEVIKDDRQRKNFEEREEKIRQERQKIEEEIGEFLNYYLITRNGSPISALYHHMVKTAWEDEDFTTLVDLGKFEKNGDKYVYENYEEGTRSFTEEEMQKDMRRISKLYKKFEALNEELSGMEDKGWKSDGSDTKFQEYATNWQDEYDNYRELLFTIPNAKGVKEFSSVHWGEKNVLAHTRLNDYKDTDGNKVLFIEEIQSDMHQTGRKYGYGKDESKLANLEKQYKELYDKLEKLKDVEKTTEEYKKIQRISEEKKKISENIEKNKDNFNQKYEFNVGLSGTYDLITNFYDGYKLPESNEWMAKTVAQEIAVRQLQFNNGYFQQGTKEIEKLMEKENLSFRDSAYKILDEQKMIDLVRNFKEVFEENNELIRKGIKLNVEYHEARESLSKLEIYKQISQEQGELNELSVEIDKLKNSDRLKPSNIFPFKKNWHEFVLRKIINEAVKQGYDKVAWTTGKQQNDRYNLSKYVDAIEYYENDNGKSYDIYVYQDGAVLKTFNEYPKEQLEELVGKEIANKMINGEGESRTVKSRFKDIEREGHILEGVDLEIGGEGMKGFYDKIIPEYLNKYLKKWNSKVEDVSIPSDYGTTNVQQGFVITPEMRETIKKTGQPLYDAENGIDNMSKKNIINKIKETFGTKDFVNSNKELNEIASDIKKRIRARTITTNEISNIVKELGQRLQIVTDKYDGQYDDLKDEIRKTKIYVTDIVKKGFADWNDFRKNNFGTLRLTNDAKAMNVSEMYLYLQDKYGIDMFPEKITNESDQLEKISEVANDIKKYNISIEEYSKNMYGTKGWEEIQQMLIDEIKAIRDEYDLENPIDKAKQARVIDTKTKEILLAIGITEEEMYDPANAYIQNLLETLENNKEYFSKSLHEIEELNLLYGDKKTNNILQKRRYDVQNGLVKANPNYSEGASLSAMRKEIEKYLGRKIGIGGFRQRAYGIYKPTIDTIRIKDISNVETAIHELGHRVDFKELQRSLVGRSAKELDKLAERAFGKMYDKQEDRKLEEGWAEFTKRFVVDNQTTLKEYPELSAYMLEQLEGNKNMKTVIENLIELAEQYVNAPTEKQIRKMQSIGEDTDKKAERNFFDKFMYEVYDDLWDIKQMTSEFAKAKGTKLWEMNPEDNIYNLMRTLRANEDRVLNVMKYGLIDDNGIKRTKGIAEIVEKLDQNPEKIQKVRDLMLALRTLDYSAIKLETGLAPEEALKLISKYSQEKDVLDTANGIMQFQEEIMKYAVEKGLMKETEYEEMKKWNKFYIPLKRVYEGKTNSSIGSKGASKLTKQRTGSMRDVIDPFESIIQNTSMILTKINQNDLMKTLARLQEQTGLADFFEIIPPPQRLKAEVDLNMFKNILEEQGVDTDELDLDVVQRIFNPVMNDDSKMIMGYMDNGVLKAIEFKDRNIYDIMSKTTNGADLGVFLETLEKFTGLLRMGATTGNIEFAVPNVISDTMTAWMFSESGFVPFVDSLKGVYDYMLAEYAWFDKVTKAEKYKQKNKYFYDLYKQSGATMATRVASYRPEVQEYVLEVFGKHANDLFSNNANKSRKAGKAIMDAIMKSPQKLQDVLSIIPELSEQGTRFESFKKDYNYFRKKGHNHKNALLQASANTRDITMDFNRMGRSMRYYNRIRAFSGARTQGMYRFIEGVQKMPKKVATKLGIMVGISLAILTMAKNSGNKKEEEVTDQVRKDNFIIPLGKEGEILTIKKPQGAVRNVINFAEMMYNVAIGATKEEEYDIVWRNWVKDTIAENSPIELDLKEGNSGWSVFATAGLPTATEPIIENALDRDFYYGNPINPYGSENLHPSDRYDENTSQTAIKLAKAWNATPLLGDWFATSPNEMENAITGWFAGVGQQALNISDNILGQISDKIPEQPTRDKNEQTILKRFFANSYKNSESVSEVYETLEKLEQLKEYGEASEGELKTLKDLKQATETMKELNKKIKETRNSLKLNAEEKKDKINELQELRTDTARYYLGKELINNKNKEQIELYEYYPASDTYTYEPNKLSKVDVTFNEEDKKKYAEICKEEYEDAISKLEKKASYKKASTEEQEKMRASELTKARNTAKETVSKEVYKRNKGAK